MTRHRLVLLYKLVVPYGVMSLILGKSLAPITLIALGFPMIAYLAMEWIATPVVAGFAGLQSRYSHRQALLLGVPLVLLFTVATPTASSGGAGLYVIVPWLSLYQAKKVQMLPVLTQRLEWWAVIYALGYALGVVSRRLRPPGVPGDS